MEISFQLLDVTYEMQGTRPTIVMLSRLSDGRRALLHYNGFLPYFYAIPEPGASLEALTRAIMALSRQLSPIVSVEPVSRTYYGKPVVALKITTMAPKSVREYREQVAELPGVKEVLEADIRFSMRFLIDFNLYPMRWYSAKVKGSKPRMRGLEVYEVDAIEEDPSKINADPLEGLKIMAFDIEVYNAGRTPNARSDPVIMIGYATSDNKEVKILEAGSSDASIIEAFVKTIREEDPDIIVGYNQNRFDWPYLLERAKLHGIDLSVGRLEGLPQEGPYGHVSVPGRLNVDLLDYAASIGEVKVKTLDEVADYLGVMKKEERTNIEWWQIGEHWRDPAKRETLRRYLRDDVISTLGLAYKFLPFGAQLSQVSGLPLDQVMSASTGHRLEWRLMREAFKRGELVPNREERDEESYEGAVVLAPRQGIHENVAVIDFASMYPSIMIKYNVGPDTLLRGEEAEAYEAPDVGHRFRKEPPGFMKSVLERFLKWRKEIRKVMGSLSKDSPEYRLLDERQKAIKILANASYGYLGWVSARWYCRECAEAVTAWGRSLIRTSIERARHLGLEVIYGDTDSLFVKNDPDKISKLLDFVERELGFEAKVDKVYLKVLFTEAKKRYVGLTQDMKIDVVGFEAVRGDWSELAKEAQASVAEIVLKKGSVQEAVSYVKDLTRRLKEGKIEMEKLVIWKTITRRIDEYKAEQPHVSAAKIMMKQGIKVEPGSKVGYVVVKGHGPLYTRARPYFMARMEDIDVDYYVEKQIVPAVLRILAPFGVTERTLTGAGRTLMDYI